MDGLNVQILIGTNLFSPDSTIQLTPESDIKISIVFQNDKHKEIQYQQISLQLDYQERGRGNIDKKIAVEKNLYPSLSPGNHECIVEFRTPNEPWSYDGYYLKIIWTLRIICKSGFLFGKSEWEFPIILRPIEVVG
jgi:hypothetical protein